MYIYICLCVYICIYIYRYMSMCITNEQKLRYIMNISKMKIQAEQQLDVSRNNDNADKN